MRELTRNEFLEEFKGQWQIGEHVTIIGTTGSGKTFLAEDIYNMRRFVVVIATKSSDETLTDYGKDFYRIKKWPPSWHQEKVLFWKKPDVLGEFSDQREAIYKVLSAVYKSGNRTIGLDDVVYMVRQLKLQGELAMLYTQARSQNISLVGNIQRPFWVPLEVTNQATHVLLFGVRDKDDVDRVAEAQGIRKDEIRGAVSALNKYDFAWVRTGVSPVIVRNEEKE